MGWTVPAVAMAAAVSLSSTLPPPMPAIPVSGGAASVAAASSIAAAPSLFELLFKYPVLLYERGELAFSAPAGWVPVAATLLLVAAVATYAGARGRAGAGDRWLLAAVRLVLLALVAVLLMRPVLLVPTVVPQENYLAVLVDDSRSMRIDDGVSRAGVVHDAFLDPASPVLAALSEKFRLRLYRFSDVASRLEPGATLDFAGSGTRLGRALAQVRDELASLPLSGLVVVSDGADRSPRELDDALPGLRAAGVPVFAVGVGSEAFRRDIEVAGVSVPRRTLAGSALVADVALAHRGYGGRTVPVIVERDGRIVGRREVRLGDDGAAAVRVDFLAGDPGAATYRIRVPVQEGELVERNNEREVTVGVGSGPHRILYFEGEPRHEVAFLRRAVAPDPGLRLVVLQRTDDERFLRLGVDGPGELAAGFPRTREELFAYRALVLGSVEASAFTHDQLAMIEEFVERRGGGLLVLGGRGALAEGGWAGTPAARALPIRLDGAGGARADTGFLAQVTVAPTRAAATHPITRLPPDAPVTPWSDLPPLTAFNRTGPVKPGASALLVARGGDADGQAVLAEQRYGRGRAAVFAVHDSWLWQMHADIPLEDQTHERLWRQLLRWLVAETPDRVVAELPLESVGTGASVAVRAVVRDERFGGVNRATVRARVTTPSGAIEEVPLTWSAGGDGEYEGRLVAEEAGEHEVRVVARYDTVVVESEPAALRAGPDMGEYFDAAMRRDALERLARATGGRFYEAADVGRLAEELAYTARGATVVEENELWDTPAAFLAILFLLSAEWAHRRRRGLA